VWYFLDNVFVAIGFPSCVWDSWGVMVRLIGLM
jgi:hypothetical protein